MAALGEAAALHSIIPPVGARVESGPADRADSLSNKACSNAAGHRNGTLTDADPKTGTGSIAATICRSHVRVRMRMIKPS